MGTLLIEKLREQFCNEIFNCISIVPSSKVSDIVVEPYNAILALNQLIGSVDSSVCIDNEALYDICYNTLRLKEPTYSDLNHLIATGLSNISAS